MPNIIIDFNSFVLVLLLKRVPALSEREHISELTDPCCGCVFYRQAGWRRGCIWWCPVCRVLWMRVQQGILGSDRRRWGAAPLRSCSAEPAATAGTDACPRSGSTHTHTDHHHPQNHCVYTYQTQRQMYFMTEPDNNQFGFLVMHTSSYLEWVSSVQKLFENWTWIIKIRSKCQFYRVIMSNLFDQNQHTFACHIYQ